MTAQPALRGVVEFAYRLHEFRHALRRNLGEVDVLCGDQRVTHSHPLKQRLRPAAVLSAGVDFSNGKALQTTHTPSPVEAMSTQVGAQ